MNQLLGLLSNDPLVIAEGMAYMRIICFSYIIFTVTRILVASLRSIGAVKIGYIISFSTLCINVCLNYLLIYGHFGFPELGVEGAALATVISQAVSFICCIIFLWKNRSKLGFQVEKEYFLHMDRWRNFHKQAL